ncbi:3741_t:CDS:1 [Dentiscutata heterogama]|uniref:3741_t:CDS:1 n=1 Tax=Dentiscutata heterogama TaxID=1316150 RepID=A0ACA9P2S3_9GLOM|nr:3741_t:CDS:1 [Dentiscutata heterogama]
MNVLKLLIAADELDLQKLIEYVQSYLFDKKIEFLTDNYLEILKIVFRHEELSKLRDFCLNRVAEDPGVLFKSPNFYTIDKSLLRLILQQENLAIDEMEVCKFMIQYAITQSLRTLNIEDILELTSEDLSIIKGTLQEFIPLIRWFQISNENFLKFQKLFEIILPSELYENIKKFNFKKEIENKSIILPPRIPHIDSKLLGVEHFAMISSWIDRNNTQIYKTQFPYKFKLLYRASENGFEVENFHILCDRKGPTVTISKFARNGKIIGGYNPLDWKPQNETIENTTILDYHSWWATSGSYLCIFNRRQSRDFIAFLFCKS